MKIDAFITALMKLVRRASIDIDVDMDNILFMGYVCRRGVKK